MLRCTTYKSLCLLLFLLSSVVLIFVLEQMINNNSIINLNDNLLYGNSFNKKSVVQNDVSSHLKKELYLNSKDTIVIYNRIPKTGSTSFINVAYDLCRENSFNVIHLNVTKNSHIMSLADQARFVYNITYWMAKKPALYHGHVAYIDFNKFGISHAIYINILRKPLDRLISYYYFLRYGDDYRPRLIRSKHGNKLTFDECVKRKEADCHPNHMWLQIPFLCGQSAACWIPGNEWALEQAKQNLITKYLAVGVTDEITNFISVLESVIPSFFRGATEHFMSSRKTHLRKTNKKIKPSEETQVEIMKSKIWQMENELYEFAYQQFQQLKKQMGVNSNGTLYDKGVQFKYEKIYPK